MHVTEPIRFLRGTFEPIGAWAYLLKDAFSSPAQFGKYRYDLFRQLVEIGLSSLPVVLISAVFIGAVTAIQADYQMNSPLVPESAIGMIVSASVILELGVLITAFILSGRIAARIAAELGSMRIGEQIDAMEVMGVNAAGYLVAPRVIAGTLALPMLYVAACGAAIGTAILMAQARDIVSVAMFMEGARSFFSPYDAFYGMTKAATFGFLLTSIACYKGFHASGGAEGIGESATQAAVLSCVYVLVADYILAEILL